MTVPSAGRLGATSPQIEDCSDESSVALLDPYKATYLDQATRVRETMTFSYQRGGASLIDFLQSQQEYRAVQVSFVNLIAAFLNAVNQLNLAIGQEVIP